MLGMRKNVQNPEAGQVAGEVIVGGRKPAMSGFSVKNRPTQLLMVALVAVVGTITLVASHASTPALTKTWSTNADWNTGALSNVTVNNNVVSLAKKTSTTANMPKSSTADVAAFKPTACSSTASTSHPCKAIDDENASTWWVSNSSDPQWAQVDLGQAYNLSEVKVRWKAQYAKAYQVQVSNDGTTWQTVFSTTTGAGGTKDITGINAVGRYVRMYGTKRATSGGYSLYALKVYGQPTSSTGTTYVPSGTETLSFDATAASQWDSITPVSNLPVGTAIGYQYRTSTDNSTWSSWSDKSTIANAPQTRYIQIKATLSTTNTTVTPSLVSLTLAYSSQASAPVVSLTATPTSIQAGQAATLNWSSQNATTCTASGGWSGTEPISGSASTGNLSQTTTYTITCTGDGGSANSSTTVTVQPVVVGGGGTTSSTCTNPIFTSSGAEDTYNTDPNDGHQYFWVNNDAWSGSHGPQTINVCSESSWYAVSNQPDNGGQVETYPDTEYDVGGRANPSTKAITQWNSITSTFSESYPSSGSWDAAYDLWTNNWSNETMVWNQWAGSQGYWGNCAEPGPSQNTCGEKPAVAATIGGVNYHFLALGDTDASGNPIQCTTANESNCELIFFRDNQVTSGSVDLLGIFQWEVAHGYAKATDVPTQLEYGVEVCSTSGTETFPMNGLSFSLN